jgi:hypothetical protein
MGRGLPELHNIHVTGKWSKGKAWAAIKMVAPQWVIELLEMFIKILNLSGIGGAEVDAPASGGGGGGENSAWSRTVS